MSVSMRSWARSMILMGSPLSSTNYSPPLPNTAGLEHQLHGLADGHEVATHLGVGDGNRPAGFDLPEEGGDDRATRAEHIAEAHRQEVAAGGLGGGAHHLLGGLTRVCMLV